MDQDRAIAAFAAGRTLTLADIGVGDTGDWSKLEQPSGNKVNVVSMGNGPSAVVNQLVAGGGLSSFDVINIGNAAGIRSVRYNSGSAFGVVRNIQPPRQFRFGASYSF